MKRKNDEAAEQEETRAEGGDSPIVDLDFLRGLIAAVDGSGIDSLEVTREGTKIRVSKSPPGGRGGASQAPPAPAPAQAPPTAPEAPATAPPPSAAPAAPTNNWVEVKSPMVGTFYRAPAPEAPPYVEPGTRVSKGQTLCILEAMKLMNELESEVSGVIREVCVENSEPVEYGQVLFRVEPEA